MKLATRALITGASAVTLILGTSSAASAHNQYQEYSGNVATAFGDHVTLEICDQSADGHGASVDWYKNSSQYGSKGDANGSSAGCGRVTLPYNLVGALWRICEAGTGCTAYRTIS